MNFVDRIEVLRSCYRIWCFHLLLVYINVEKIRGTFINWAIHNVHLTFCLFALVPPISSPLCDAIIFPKNQSESYENSNRLSVQLLKEFLVSWSHIPPFLDQVWLPINKTDVGIRTSAYHSQPAYVGSVFQSSVFVEKLPGHNRTEDITFVEAIEELGKIATTLCSEWKIQEELDNSAYDNMWRIKIFIREKPC